ncbi:hypothetical protein BGZ96_009634 [Linnemannia gamsii]|uniref:Adhesin domain-containing protein n=1 Tax=Linnemannia gamsii TaxID=64522 RepID=A0ABQ7JXR3_9FUNG|nr:hypothetical protein BGZ96_009634 [Linnemannia gamsii]
MADHCNNSNSSSQHPSVCCVHNTETQPLLGYHNGHHASGSQYQAPPPPAYYVDMSGNSNKGGCYTPSHAPDVQRQCYCQQQHCHGHGHQHQQQQHHNQQTHGEREERDGSGCCLLIFALLFVILMVNPTVLFHRYSFTGFWNNAGAPGSSTASTSMNSLDLLTNDSDNLSFDRCRDNAINWDGPSTFTTEVRNFRLKIGQGNIFSRVNISTGPVAFPTLHILGEVSPYEDELKSIKPAAPTAHGEKIDIDYLGLHIAIVEEDNQLDTQIWYDNREVVDPRDGQHYRACARLFLEVILPESYTSYGAISVDGPLVVINTHDLENVKFDRLHFGSTVGEISTHGRVHADVFDAKSNTGRIRAETVQVATTGKPLDIQVYSITGSVQVTAETTDVDASEENPHKIHVSTNTGPVKLTVQPSSSSSSSKHGNLDISTTASTGAIENTINLASQEQILTLTSKTNTGSIRNHISDAFLGHFSLSTKWGSTIIKPAKGSKSTITYEKLSAREKVGTKELSGSPEGAIGSIVMSTSTGSTDLQFTNYDTKKTNS